MALTKRTWLSSGICLGDEIFITGAFVGRVGESKNIPVIRIGNIAAMPEEPIDFSSPKRPAYLIETRSLGGISGSPVFLNLQPQRIRGRVEHGRPVKVRHIDSERLRDEIQFPYLLIGMIIGLHGGTYPTDFVSEDDTDGLIAPKDVEFNAGISVVITVQDIIDFLYSERLKQARRDTIGEKKKQSGYRPASARRGVVPSSDDANPKDTT
jgi:hypothetical protein